MATLLGAALVTGAMAQDVISTDRPSFSDGTSIVPKGRWQIEAGYTFNSVDGARFETFGEFLFRYPLSNEAEFRLLNVTWARNQDDNGMLDPVLGVKLKLRNNPDFALVLQSTVPAGNRAFRVDRAQPTAKIAFYKQLDATTGWGGNLLVSDLGEDAGRFTQYGVSLYLSKTLNAKTGAFLEAYRLMPISDGGPDGTFADTGVTYLLNNRTQLDARIGSGFNQKRDGWFLGFGVSYRF